MRSTRSRSTKSRNWRFITYNLYSRMIIPFAAVLFTTFRETLPHHSHSLSTNAWISIIVSLVFFYFMQIPLLKHDSHRFQRGDLWLLGFCWVAFAVASHIIAGHMFYGMTWISIIHSYSLIHLSPWAMVLASLFVMPRLAAIGTRGWLF